MWEIYKVISKLFTFDLLLFIFPQPQVLHFDFISSSLCLMYPRLLYGFKYFFYLNCKDKFVL